MSGFLRVFQVFEKLFEARYRRRYDARLQLMAYERIQGELMKPGIRIGITTVSDILRREGIHPAPNKERGQPPSTWKLFIDSHMDTLVATDFFSETPRGKPRGILAQF